MHAVVMESLEEYLSGTLKPAALRDIEAHLSTCETCRQEVAGMQEVSQWFGALKVAEELEPAPGFLRAGDAAGGRPPGGALLRRLLRPGFRLRPAVGVCLAADAGGAGQLPGSCESGYPTGLSPEAVMAQQDSPAFDSARAQDNMLATMTL